MIAMSGLTAERSRRSTALTLLVTTLPATQLLRSESSPSSASSSSARSPNDRMILSLAGRRC
jgi:hypothetical protein